MAQPIPRPKPDRKFMEYPETNLKKRKRIPRTLDEVWVYVLEDWGLLKKDLLQGLADSMQERYEQVIAAHDNPTGH